MADGPMRAPQLCECGVYGIDDHVFFSLASAHALVPIPPRASIDREIVPYEGAARELSGERGLNKGGGLAGRGSVRMMRNRSFF
jgi:hypothetical protein